MRRLFGGENGKLTIFNKISERVLRNEKHIAKIEFNGGINQKSYEKFRTKFMDLEKNAKNISAVALVVNSGGGSAVFSNHIGSLVKEFCKKENLKLMTFAEELALSGGYWILSVGDEIFCHPSSHVGSVGAVFLTLDFQKFYEKRNLKRLYISSKKDDEVIDVDRLTDVFQHKSEEEIKHLRTHLLDLHETFKNHVIKHRGDRIISDEAYRHRIFNADIFLGEEAQKIGYEK
jgi:ClpP class serine protease